MIKKQLEIQEKQQKQQSIQNSPSDQIGIEVLKNEIIIKKQKIYKQNQNASLQQQEQNKTTDISTIKNQNNNFILPNVNNKLFDHEQNQKPPTLLQSHYAIQYKNPPQLQEKDQDSLTFYNFQIKKEFENFIQIIEKPIKTQNDLKIIKDSLRQIKFFHELEDQLNQEQYEELMSNIKYEVKEEGKIIYNFGDQSDRIYILVQGYAWILLKSDINQIQRMTENMKTVQQQLLNEKVRDNTKTKEEKKQINFQEEKQLFKKEIMQFKKAKFMMLLMKLIIGWAKKLQKEEEEKEKRDKEEEERVLREKLEKIKLDRENDELFYLDESQIKQKKLIDSSPYQTDITANNNNNVSEAVDPNQQQQSENLQIKQQQIQKRKTNIKISLFSNLKNTKNNNLQSESTSESDNQKEKTRGKLQEVRMIFPEFQIVECYKGGEIFGEEQIIKNIRRTTTIFTKKDCHMFTLSKEIFNKLLFQIRYKKMRETLNFLSGMDYFMHLQQKLYNLIFCFKPKTYQRGEFVYRQGDVAKYYYFIKSGEVEVSQQSQDLNKKEIQTLDQLQAEKYLKNNQTLPSDIDFDEANYKFQQIEQLENYKTKKLNKQQVDSQIKISILGVNCLLGDDEILNNKTYRQQVKVISATLQVFRLKKKNLQLLDIYDTIKEMILNQSQTKDEWRTKYIKKCSYIKRKIIQASQHKQSKQQIEEHQKEFVKQHIKEEDLKQYNNLQKSYVYEKNSDVSQERENNFSIMQIQQQQKHQLSLQQQQYVNESHNQGDNNQSSPRLILKKQFQERVSNTFYAHQKGNNQSPFQKNYQINQIKQTNNFQLNNNSKIPSQTERINKNLLPLQQNQVKQFTQRETQNKVRSISQAHRQINYPTSLNVSDVQDNCKNFITQLQSPQNSTFIPNSSQQYLEDQNFSQKPGKYISKTEQIKQFQKTQNQYPVNFEDDIIDDDEIEYQANKNKNNIQIQNNAQKKQVINFQYNNLEFSEKQSENNYFIKKIPNLDLNEIKKNQLQCQKELIETALQKDQPSEPQTGKSLLLTQVQITSKKNNKFDYQQIHQKLLNINSSSKKKPNKYQHKLQSKTANVSFNQIQNQEDSIDNSPIRFRENTKITPYLEIKEKLQSPKRKRSQQETSSILDQKNQKLKDQQNKETHQHYKNFHKLYQKLNIGKIFFDESGSIFQLDQDVIEKTGFRKEYNRGINYFQMSQKRQIQLKTGQFIRPNTNQIQQKLNSFDKRNKLASFINEQSGGMFEIFCQK